MLNLGFCFIKVYLFIGFTIALIDIYVNIFFDLRIKKVIYVICAEFKRNKLYNIYIIYELIM